MTGTVIKYGFEALPSVHAHPRPHQPDDRPGEEPRTAPVADRTPDVEALGARICALASRIARATHQWLAMIAEFDERRGWSGVGITSCAHWLSWTCSIAPGTAREHVRVARTLTGLPLVSAEMAAGRLSYAKVRELTRIADRVDEEYLVKLARTATASQLIRAVRGYRRAAGDRARQEQARTATWFTDTDGSVVFSARLPAEDGAALIAALEVARDDLLRSERRGGSAPQCTDEDGAAADGGRRPPPNRADMVVHLARGYTAATPHDRSGEDRTTVVVHVSADHLAGGPAQGAERSRGNAAADPHPGEAMDSSGIPTDCCQIPAVGGIEAAAARRLACDAVVIGMVRGVGGAVLAHGRRRRVVSEPQRRALQVRDGHCQFPACHRTTHLEAHHVIHWSRGGRTDMANLVLLCRFHHIACHEGGATITPAADSTRRHARWQFRTPAGEPFAGDRLGTLTVTGIEAWAGDNWPEWGHLDRVLSLNHPEAKAIRPLWRGERVSIADTVSVLFGKSRREAARDAAA